MSLQETLEILRTGPPRDDRWEDVEDFSTPSRTEPHESFDAHGRGIAISDAQADVVKAYHDAVHDSDEDMI